MSEWEYRTCGRLNLLRKGGPGRGPGCKADKSWNNGTNEENNAQNLGQPEDALLEKV